MHQPDGAGLFGQLRQFGGIGLGLARIEPGLVGIVVVQHRQRQPAQIEQELRHMGLAHRVVGGGALQPLPAGAGADAVFMIAPRQYDGGGVQQRRGGFEEVGVPGGPVVAPGRAGTSLVSWRALALAIEIVADMDHQVGLEAGGGARDRRERPRGGIVAGLQAGTLDAAASVAKDKDALRVGDDGRQRDAIDAGMNTGRNRGGANQREVCIGRGAHRHRRVARFAVQRRALCGSGDKARFIALVGRLYPRSIRASGCGGEDQGSCELFHARDLTPRTGV